MSLISIKSNDFENLAYEELNVQGATKTHYFGEEGEAKRLCEANTAL